MKDIPAIRLRVVNDIPLRKDGDYVLYWMIAFRRTLRNFSLQRAVYLAIKLNKPLVIIEALRVGYRWHCDRFHQFILDGMADNQRFLAGYPVMLYTYLEPEEGAGKGMLEAAAVRACAVVTDDFPAFFLPKMVQTVASRLATRLELVDSNGLLPMAAANTVYPTAYAFRRFLQKNLPEHLMEYPVENPLDGAKLPVFEGFPADFTTRWPAVDAAKAASDASFLQVFPINHNIKPTGERGGSVAAQARMADFLKRKIDKYAEDRNEPEQQGASGLSPYLHFGHLSTHEIFAALMKQEGWSMKKLSSSTSGQRSGWWGASDSAESFLDELVTWREIGFNMCRLRPDDYDKYESLPEWAQTTLEEHAGDKRPWLYTLDQFDRSETHDELWNAAQTQLVREGRIHNYLRMLWGKKILEWSQSPREALDIMIDLNNRYALDGRNPNSYSGIFWVLGRYDRAWGPERPIFGKIRYMTSDNTVRKYSVKKYIATYRPSRTKDLFDG